MERRELEQTFSYWRRRIFLTLWVTYGCFYLCRVNMSIALPSIMKEFDYSKTDMGAMGSAFFIAYAIGQFINGQLGDKFGARKFITLGIVFSSLLNIVFGFTTTLLAMTIIWGANGYFQAIGWSPSIKTLANWFPQKERGRISGLYGSSPQVGNAISWLLAGYLCLHYGWRYAFWVPGVLFLFCGLHFYLRCRNSPEETGLPSIEEYERRKERGRKKDSIAEVRPERDEHLGFGFTLRKTLGNPRIWCVGMAYLFLGLVGFGFIFWVPSHMFQVQKTSTLNVALRAMVFPLGGSLGGLTAGWLSDRLFQSRRAPIIVLMSILSGIFVLLYSKIPGSAPLLSVLCLGVVGFTTLGAHITMATSVPMDYGTRKAASSAAGFIDGLGYVGAAVAVVGAGWLVDNYNSWNYAFYFWACGAFIAGILMAFLWKYVPPKGKYM